MFRVLLIFGYFTASWLVLAQSGYNELVACTSPQGCSALNVSTPFCLSPYTTVDAPTYCRPCMPQTFFESNCDCPVNLFCSAAASDVQPTYGYCVPYTLTGKACNVPGDCQTQSQQADGQGTGINEYQFCVNGPCQPCGGTSSSIYVTPTQCPGWSGGALQSAYPGVYRQCTAAGQLVSTGSVDYELGLVSPSASASKPPTPSLSAGASASATPSKPSSGRGASSTGQLASTSDGAVLSNHSVAGGFILALGWLGVALAWWL